MWLTIISSLLQLLLLGVLGIITATFLEFTQRHRKAIVVTFCAVSLVLAALAIFGAVGQQRDADSLKAAITGGDAFPVVVAQASSPPISFVMHNRGHQPLTGISITVTRWNHDYHRLGIYSIGTLPGVQPSYVDLPFSITPRTDDEWSMDGSERSDHYQLQILTQNGRYTEDIWFKHNRCGGWANHYSLARVLEGRDMPERFQKLLEKNKGAIVDTAILTMPLETTDGRDLDITCGR